MAAGAAEGHSVSALREMDRKTARQSLTVDEFERWEKLQERFDAAADTREEWADEAEMVEDIVVHADPESLGTRVGVHGNDLLVRVSPEDERFTDAARQLDEEFGDLEAEAALELGDSRTERLCDRLLTMLDAALLKWNGEAWSSLPEAERAAVLDQAREKWGVDGLLKAWFAVAQAMAAEREDMEASVRSFRES